MKHAILILAHKDFAQLIHLVEYFQRDCFVFIHLDKKFPVSDQERAELYSYLQVKGVYAEYSVHWGGFCILRSEIFLLEKALSACDADYFHLISGQDYPIRPLDTFLEFWEKNAGKDFLQYVHLPHPKWDRNTFSRFQYYYPYDYFNDSKYSKTLRKITDFQKKHGIKRRIPDPFDHLYGNSQWFSLTRGSVATLVDYTRKKPRLYRRMWMTFAPEESYISTVLVNLLGHENIVSYNKRFIRWKYENGNSPANLGLEHFRYLVESDSLFARKFELPCSNGLMQLVDKYLITADEDITYLPTGGWNYDGFLKYPFHYAFVQAVKRLCCDLNIATVVDVGCGAGIHVAELFHLEIDIVGFDANPHVGTLSQYLLPESERSRCWQADVVAYLYPTVRSGDMQGCFELYSR